MLPISQQLNFLCSSVLLADNIINPCVQSTSSFTGGTSTASGRAHQGHREEGRPRKDLKKLRAAAAQSSSCAKFATEGAYHANLSIFIYSAVTFNYKGHAPGCVNLHNPSYRRFIVPYAVQMYIVRTSPCPKALICPVNKESEGEIKCPGRRITAGHGHIGKPDFCIHS